MPAPHRNIVAALAVVALAPGAARADTAAGDNSSSGAVPAPIEERSHLRFGIGAAAGIAGSDASSAFGLGPGAYARLGYGVSEGFGVDLDLSACTLILANFAHAAALATWTPRDSFSYALGPVVSGYFVAGLNGSSSGGSVGGMARVDFHTRRHHDGNHRSALTFGIAVDAGYDPSTANPGRRSQIAGGLMFTIGRSRY
jgi:hypothetical protein